VRRTVELSIEQIVEQRSVTAVYQPIVDLDSGRVVAYEALARGPFGSSLEFPDRMFAAAAERGLTDALDWVCRAAALQGALEAGLGRSTTLFVNVEPSSLRAPPPPSLHQLIELATSALSIVVEVTERSLVRDPAALISAISRARAAGMGIAIDDVGAELASLALLPFVEPDVIKLDMSLVRRHADREIASIAGAVRADAERRGATILAEGIETDEHLARALVLGARLGQGWLFGRPEALLSPQPHRQRRSDSLLEFAGSQPVPGTPWSLVANSAQRRTTTKRLLLPMSHHIEQRALVGDPCVVISAFQNSDHFTSATRRRYEELAIGSSLVGAIATNMSGPAGAGVRRGSVPSDHPLAGEWTVTVVGPHDAAALIARDLGDSGPDDRRAFEYVITHDRATVIAAARSLMHHIDPD
jgi:EAL domain-containing protein (putative c-di-GMP-specific phosphodiesterase class I)